MALPEIFLSASVPVNGRRNFVETADPFLINAAVRALATTVLGRMRIVFGGHPSITPLLWAVCEHLGVEHANAVVLYQSRFFEGQYPRENNLFPHVEYIDAVSGDVDASLMAMRQAMLSRPDLQAAAFIGGMEGIFEEYALFSRLHPNGTVIAVPAPGGAALELALQLAPSSRAELDDVDFTELFHRSLHIDAAEPRVTTTRRHHP